MRKDVYIAICAFLFFFALFLLLLLLLLLLLQSMYETCLIKLYKHNKWFTIRCLFYFIVVLLLNRHIEYEINY